MEINLKLPSPHSVEQRMIMEAMVTPGLLELWVPCGTKFGKTMAGAGAISVKMPIKSHSVFRWVAPVFNQARIGLRYCQNMLPPEPYTHITRHDIVMPHINSRLEFRSGDNPENLEGEGVNGGYILDECSKLKPEVYSSAKTTVTLTRAPLICISTPRGKNWFYKKCMEAKEEMEWAIKKGITPTKLFVTAHTAANPFVPREAIEEARKSLPLRLFKQYYLAEFVDDGTVFAGFRSCLFGDYFELETEYQRWFMPGHDKCQVVIGVDWAKTEDRTVFIAIDLTTRRVVGIERFYKTPYTEAVRRLVLFTRKFKDVLVVKHDKTGVGSAIDDQLAYTGLPYEGVIFTNASKCDMVAKLITATEQNSIGLPNWKDLVKEMDSYEVVSTNSGNLSYNAPSGEHDDIVCAIMLCNLALIQYSDSGMEIMFIDDLVRNKELAKPTSVEEYYKSLSEDAEWT